MGHRALFIALFEAFLVLGSLTLAWMLRFEFTLPVRSSLWVAAPILVIIRLAAMARFNLLHGWWRYAGISDTIDIGKSVALGSVGFLVAVRYVLGLYTLPWSLYFVEGVLTFGFLTGVRLLSRLIADSVQKEHMGSRTAVAIIGAGFAAQMVIRELNRNGSEYRAVVCFDDNPSKHGIKLHGVPVVGSVDELPAQYARFGVDEILIAVPSATGLQMRRFVEICKQTGLKYKTLPALRDLVAGRATLSQVREVNLEDLLGREPVTIDLEAVRKHIQGAVIMVTGAAGSIGSELTRQILERGPARLVCVDHNETGIFYLERELLRRENGDRAVCLVANVGDAASLRRVCATHQVEMIFHAAAYKHVPVMEANVQEAVNNNVFGLLCLLAVAEDTGCKTFVMISSDKAVNPTSIMGCTKRIGELILSAWPSKGMRCVSVRFGNVLGSSGSVVPVFQEQLTENLPLTITHPEIQRFFMTVPEAVALVLQASVIGNNGEILVLDMGEPVRIVDLAHTLIELSGKSREDVDITFTGLRQGEKLFEELFYPEERIIPTPCDKIKRTSTIMLGWPELKRHLDELRASMHVDGADPVRRKLKQIVPQCRFLEPPQAVDPAMTRSARVN
jgi:FlaA1/EpsC-like NDP-sugar epimerase